MPADGPFDPQLFTLFKELTAALIAYTPPHFKNVQCTVTVGLKEGQKALFYDIQCPQFPDEGTNVVSDQVQKAATALVQFWTQEGVPFPGLQVSLTQRPDGTWENNIGRLDKITKRATESGAQPPSRKKP